MVDTSQTTDSQDSAASAPPDAPDRRAMLMRELQTEGLDADTEALLRWDFARQLENTDDPAGAVKAYLVSYNLTPAFRPPLDALVRVFGRRRSFKNLKRLLEATLKSTVDTKERASAMLDLASFAERHEGDRTTAIEWAERALETNPDSRFAAYTLERLGRNTADASLIARSLEARAHATDDLVLKGLYLHDLAEARASKGEVDAAVAALDEAAQLPAVRWRSFSALERLARKYDRPADLARALEELGSLALVAPGEPAEGSGAFQMDRYSDEQRAKGEGVACLYEAAMLHLEFNGDAQTAVKLLARTSALRPDDAFIRRGYIRALRAAGDVEGVAAEARRLADSELPDDIKANLLYEAALATQGHDHPAAMATLEQARALAPRSAALEATENHWLQSGGYLNEWVNALERPLPSSATAEERNEASANLWRAGIVSSRRLKDFPRARAAFERAALCAEDSLGVLRDLYEECLVHGEFVAAQEVLAAMWGQDLEDEERSALHADRVRLAASSGDEATLRQHLEAALVDESTSAWAPDAVRLFAAHDGDFALLASAHEALAASAVPDDDAAAAFASAARAARLAGDDARAEKNARAAVDRIPGHRYAVALLEEILRSQGKADDVVALLRTAAEARQGDAAAVVSLLNAGGAAEASGDNELAADTYEQAADLDPTNESPLWALARLGARSDDNQLVLRALEALSELELSGQGAGHATLALGEHYAVRSSKSELSEAPLEACLDSPDVAADAAFALAIQGEAAVDPALRLRALRLLAKSGPKDAAPLLRDAGITAFTGDIAPDAVKEITEELRALNPSDPYVAITALLEASPTERGDAWLNLSTTASGATRDAFTLHGLRSMMATLGPDAGADAFMIAQELAGSDSEFAAIAVDETLEASDDADPRSEALIGRVPLASKATAASLLEGAGRAATAARKANAVSLLQKAIDSEPGDLASWEAMRVAARDASDWPRLAEACDQLATALGEGPFYGELIEESAAVRMDYLGDDEGARERLEKLMEAQPARERAYHRLHDLLAEAGDTHGLSQIVAQRLENIDDSDELERLFYEQARLHRSHGDLQDALFCLENLAMLNEGHVGGIALAIEINVALEQWDDAVAALRALATADVPNKQKRIALLGAADFLERKKGDSTAALTELRRIEELGLADNALYVRMADVALRAGQSEEAVRTLLNAADQYQGTERAHLLRRAGSVQREDLRDEGGALLSYRQALSIEPTNLESAEAVAALLPPGEMRHAHAAEFANSVRSALRTSTIDFTELQKLQRAAEWLDDRVMREAVLEVIEVLRLDDTQERTLTPELKRPMPKRELTADEVAALHIPPVVACAQIAEAAEETIASMDGLDLGTFGVARKDTVSKHDRVREVLENACAAFGIPVGEVYRGGSSDGRVIALPGKRDRTDWVVGTSVRGSIGAARVFDIGRQVYAAHARLRSLAPHGSVKGATMLFAVCAAAGRPIAAGESRPGVSEWTRAAEGAISRKGRKNIAAAVAKAEASGETDLESFLAGAQRSMNRTGLLLSQDLRVALMAILESEPSSERLLRSADALDIVHTWLSPGFLDLRKKLGLK